MCGMRGFELASLATPHLWVRRFRTEPHDIQEIDKSHSKIITVAIILPEILFMPFLGHHTLNYFIIKLFRLTL